MEKRENQYDVLRILSMISVVFIHASVFQKNLFQQFVLTISGCAVPIFFMLSGSFILNKIKIFENLKKYYVGKLIKIIIPTILFSLLYIMLEIIIQIKSYGFGNIKPFIISLFKNWIKTGIPGNGWHLWFMRVIIFFYIVAPLLVFVRYKHKKVYLFIFCFSLGFSIINFYTSFINLSWYLGWIFYIPLIMAGDIIKNELPKVKYKYIVLILFVLFIGIEFFIKASLLKGNENTLLRFIIHDGTKTDIVVDPQNFQIFNLTASFLLFYFFKNLDVENNYGKLAEMCFYIYLIHYALEGIVGGKLINILSKININIILDSWYWILLRGTAVLITSFVLIYLCRKIHLLFINKIVKKEVVD